MPNLQKHFNNHTDNVNGVTFVTCKHMFPDIVGGSKLKGPVL